MTDVSSDLSRDVAIGRRVLETEAAALSDLAAGLGPSFADAIETLIGCEGRIICAGIGKSGHVARKMAATFASTGAPAQFVHSNEASHGDLGMISRRDVVIMLSKSGGSAELNDVIAFTRRFDVPLIAITAGADSTLGRAADVLLLLPDAPEACGETKAPTTSTTLSMALGDALAVALLERRGFKADDFKIYHPGGKLGAMLKRARDLMKTGDDVPVVPAGTSLADGLTVLSAKGLGCVGVTGPDGVLAGMVTDGDLRRHLAAGTKPASVDDVMTRDPYAATSDTLAAELLKEMNQRKITQVFILEDGRLAGIIHLHDLLVAGLA